MNETNHPSPLVTCTLIQDLLGITDGGIYEAVVQLNQRLDAVVAECAMVKDVGNWSLKTGMTALRDAFNVGCDAEDCLYDAVHAMLKHLPTPATDAALAEQQAIGVEKLAARRRAAAIAATDSNDSKTAMSLEGEAVRAEMFAAALRKGESQ
ncbi:TPA: hypothetical protein ACIAIE_005580 [Serratia fonticola]